MDNEFTSLLEVVKFCPVPRLPELRNNIGLLFSIAGLKLVLMISLTPYLTFI